MLNLSYIRESVNAALLDISGTTKGQLQAFTDSPLVRTTVYTRKRHRTVELEKRTVCAITDPVKSNQTRVSKTPPPPIQEITFILSSWRRAVAMLNQEKLAWISYCYGYDLNYDHQITIANHVTNAFGEHLKAARVSKKVRDRFLTYYEHLAFQQIVYEMRGVEGRSYTHAQLAQFGGVKPDNWSKNYKHHWEVLLEICRELDEAALRSVNAIRCDARSKNLAS